jgi:hypothetical protein
MLLLLISCQNPRHKFGGDVMHAQFSSKNLLACPIANSDLISMILNGLTSILTNKLLSLATVSGVLELMGLPVCWSSSMDVQPALNQAHSSNHCHFFLNLHKILCTLSVPLLDLSQNCIRPDILV